MIYVIYEEEWVRGVGSRLAVRKSKDTDDWYVGTSPKNGGYGLVEGPCRDWVTMAHMILEEEQARLDTALEESYDTYF